MVGKITDLFLFVCSNFSNFKYTHAYRWL